MSYQVAVVAAVPEQPVASVSASCLSCSDPGSIFLALLTEAISSGIAVIDDGGKSNPSGVVIGHWLSDWESIPVYPAVAYALVEQQARLRGVTLPPAEQIWNTLESAGMLVRGWDGQPISVRWRGEDLDAFIIPLTALGRRW